MAHVALDLDALTEGAQRVLIESAERGNDILVGDAEVLDLLLNLIQPASDDLQHVVALVQLPLKADHRQGIAQRLALQAAAVALQRADQCAVAVTQVKVVAAIDLQRGLRVARQQTTEHAAERGIRHLAGSGDAVDQRGGFEYRPKRDQLFIQITHGRPSNQGSALSMTPPPRQTSPS